jgi:hypothetical protein
MVSVGSSTVAMIRVFSMDAAGTEPFLFPWKGLGRLATGRGKLAKWRSQRVGRTTSSVTVSTTLTISPVGVFALSRFAPVQDLLLSAKDLLVAAMVASCLLSGRSTMTNADLLSPEF